MTNTPPGDVEPPTPEELAELISSPDGPIQSAWDWLERVVVDGDLMAAWPLTEKNLRMCLVQQVLWARSSGPSADEWVLDQHAWALSQEEPNHPEWATVQEEVLSALRAKWESAPPPDQWGAIRPRVVDGKHELVLFLPDVPSGQRVPADGRADVFPLLMERAEGRWLVAGFLDKPPTPGWPPVFPAPDGRLDVR